MGELLHLATHRRTRGRIGPLPGGARAEFFFDLASPFTYLLAEGVERGCAEVVWTPARARLEDDPRVAVESGAALGLRLTWPERWPAPVPTAMRVAGYAAEQGRGGRFVLAASRMAFGGGFDLEEPGVLADAAAAAGLAPDEWRAAAGERGRDFAARAAARELTAAGAGALPALRVGGALFAGEASVGDALRSLRRPHRFARG